MKNLLPSAIAFSFLFTLACGGGSGMSKDFDSLSKAVCACADSACATTELQKLPALVAKHKGTSATEDNKNLILVSVRTMGDCARDKKVAAAVIEAAKNSLSPSATP